MKTLLKELSELFKVMPTDAVSDAIIAVATVIVIQEKKASQNLISVGIR